MSGPTLVVLVPLDPDHGAAIAYVLAETHEQQARARDVLIERDLVAEVAYAVGELLEALDQRHDDPDEAAA